MKITKDDVAKVLASIQDLAKKQVLVGIPASKAERQEGDEEPINNAQLGYIHEFGAPASNIPARPFLNPGIARTQESINNHLQKAAKAAMDGNSEKVDVELNATGLIAQAGARNEINSGAFEALAAATLAARLRRGRTGDKPLIDTGQLRNSITYVIREKD
jgi:phage gpG-like protein